MYQARQSTLHRERASCDENYGENCGEDPGEDCGDDCTHVALLGTLLDFEPQQTRNRRVGAPFWLPAARIIRVVPVIAAKGAAS